MPVKLWPATSGSVEVLIVCDSGSVLTVGSGNLDVLYYHCSHLTVSLVESELAGPSPPLQPSEREGRRRCVRLSRVQRLCSASSTGKVRSLLQSVGLVSPPCHLQSTSSNQSTSLSSDYTRRLICLPVMNVPPGCLDYNTRFDRRQLNAALR